MTVSAALAGGGLGTCTPSMIAQAWRKVMVLAAGGCLHNKLRSMGPKAANHNRKGRHGSMHSFHLNVTGKHVYLHAATTAML